MTNKLNIWLRAIRFRFLAASALAVTCGLALTFLYQPQNFNLFYAILTYIGIFCLHSSVDLLNDYLDFKRGIDLKTKKTKFSGGTGVLPEGLLKPRHVYLVGISFLVLGLIIGIFFVIFKGYIIALILTFATLSIVLYSSKIVNMGLGELFVGIKGMLIVVGTFYVQNSTINGESIFGGIIIGFLSSLVLYVNSVPDIKPDKEMGRKTLAILLERENNLFLLTFISCLFVIIYALTIIFFLIFIGNELSLVPTLLLSPLGGIILYNFKRFLIDFDRINDGYYEKIMAKTVLFSRLFGVSLVTGIFLDIINVTIGKV